MDCTEPLFLGLSLFGVGCSLHIKAEGRTRFLMERIVPDKNAGDIVEEAMFSSLSEGIRIDVIAWTAALSSHGI